MEAAKRFRHERVAYGKSRAFLLAFLAILLASFVNLLPWILALRGAGAAGVGERYVFLDFLHGPSVFLLNRVLPGEGIVRGHGKGFFEERVGRLGSRLAGSLEVVGFWVPWALLFGALVSMVGWRKGLLEDPLEVKRERRLIFKGFVFSEVLWWILFLVAVPLPGARWLNSIVFVIGLPLVKAFHAFLAARAGFGLGVKPLKAFIGITMAHVMLIYWIPFLLLYEEFNHVEEVLLAQRSRTKYTSDGD